MLFKYCGVCNKRIGIAESYYSMPDGFVCGDCFHKAYYTCDESAGNHTVKETKVRIQTKSNLKYSTGWKNSIGDYIYYDESQRLFMVNDCIYNYHNLGSFDVAIKDETGFLNTKFGAFMIGYGANLSRYDFMSDSYLKGREYLDTENAFLVSLNFNTSQHRFQHFYLNEYDLKTRWNYLRSIVKCLHDIEIRAAKDDGRILDKDNPIAVQKYKSDVENEITQLERKLAAAKKKLENV